MPKATTSRHSAASASVRAQPQDQALGAIEQGHRSHRPGGLGSCLIDQGRSGACVHLSLSRQHETCATLRIHQRRRAHPIHDLADPGSVLAQQQSCCGSQGSPHAQARLCARSSTSASLTRSERRRLGGAQQPVALAIGFLAAPLGIGARHGHAAVRRLRRDQHRIECRSSPPAAATPSCRCARPRRPARFRQAASRRGAHSSSRSSESRTSARSATTA